MKEKLFIAWLSGIVINKETLSEYDVNAIRVSLDWVNKPEAEAEDKPQTGYTPDGWWMRDAVTTTTSNGLIITESNH